MNLSGWLVHVTLGIDNVCYHSPVWCMPSPFSLQAEIQLLKCSNSLAIRPNITTPATNLCACFNQPAANPSHQTHSTLPLPRNPITASWVQHRTVNMLTKGSPLDERMFGIFSLSFLLDGKRPWRRALPSESIPFLQHSVGGGTGLSLKHPTQPMTNNTKSACIEHMPQSPEVWWIRSTHLPSGSNGCIQHS